MLIINRIMHFIIFGISILFYSCASYNSMVLYDGTTFIEKNILEKDAGMVPKLEKFSDEIFYDNGNLMCGNFINSKPFTLYSVSTSILSINNRISKLSGSNYTGQRYYLLPGEYLIQLSLCMPSDSKMFNIITSRNSMVDDDFYKYNENSFYFQVDIENNKGYRVGITNLDFYDKNGNVLYIHKTMPVFCEGEFKLKGFKPTKIIKFINNFDKNIYEFAKINSSDSSINLFTEDWLKSKDDISNINIEGDGMRLLNVVGETDQGFRINFENHNIINHFNKYFNVINLLSGNYTIELDYFSGGKISNSVVDYQIRILPKHSYSIELVYEDQKEPFDRQIYLYDKTDKTYIKHIPSHYRFRGRELVLIDSVASPQISVPNNYKPIPTERFEILIEPDPAVVPKTQAPNQKNKNKLQQ